MDTLNVKPVTYPYFRSILRGKRSIKDVPVSIEYDVLEVAKDALGKGEVTHTQFDEIVKQDDLLSE